MVEPLGDTQQTSGGETVGPSFERGAIVGRYKIIGKIGSGGIGAVYAAHDPQLDRKVAIKVMRPEAANRLEANEARARMQREAQAMARITHPNVVSVYDVGTVGDDVFAAMELVDGVTLRSWLADQPRSAREIRDVYVQAARGLAAAHAVGLVHRDFKPENALVGRDGRVRVLDFGLARAASTDVNVPVLPLADTAVGSGPQGLTTLTRTGALVGTPAYMSPEQHLRQPVDARSDQFSFCVALYEALYGERPFAGETLGELGYAIVQGRVTPRPAGSPVEKIHGVVMRGLKVDPKDRFTSMEELIAALPERSSRRRSVIALVATGLLAAAVIAVVVTRSSSPPPDTTPSLRPPYRDVTNLDFEEGDIGAVPTGWHTVELDGFAAKLTDQGCRNGRCVVLTAPDRSKPIPDDDMALVGQQFGVRAWRGKRVRIRSHVRGEGSDGTLVSVNVTNHDGTSGFSFQNEDALIPPGDWREHDVVAFVGNDADRMNVGYVALGAGKTWIDDISIEVVPDNEPLTHYPFLPAPANLDYEEGVVGQPPPNWLVAPSLRRDAVSATISQEQPHHGRQCLLVKHLRPGSTAMQLLLQRFDLKPYRGKHLTIAAWTRSADGVIPRFIAGYATDVGTTAQAYGRAEVGLPNVWQRHVMEIDIPANADVFELGFNANAFDRFWIDDLTISAR